VTESVGMLPHTPTTPYQHEPSEKHYEKYVMRLALFGLLAAGIALPTQVCEQENHDKPVAEKKESWPATGTFCG